MRESAVIDNNGVYAVLILEPGARVKQSYIRSTSNSKPTRESGSFSIWPQAGFPRTSSTQKLRRNDIAAAIRTGASTLQFQDDIIFVE